MESELAPNRVKDHLIKPLSVGSQEAGSDDPSQIAQERDHTETEEEHRHLGREFRVNYSV